MYDFTRSSYAHTCLDYFCTRIQIMTDTFKNFFVENLKINWNDFPHVSTKSDVGYFQWNCLLTKFTVFSFYFWYNFLTTLQFSSIDSWQSNGLQHSLLSFTSPTPGTCLDLCSLSQWCHPTISSSEVPWMSCLQSFPASGFFSEKLAPIIWRPRYWSFSFSIRPSNGYSELISFRIDWFDLLVVPGTLKSLLQHQSTKGDKSSPTPQDKSISSSVFSSTLRYILEKTKLWWKFVGKVISLLFSMVSRLVIAFLPRRKYLIISWLQSPSAVILEPKKKQFVTVSIVSPLFCHEVMEPDAMILFFVCWV